MQRGRPKINTSVSCEADGLLRALGKVLKHFSQSCGQILVVTARKT